MGSLPGACAAPRVWHMRQSLTAGLAARSARCNVWRSCVALRIGASVQCACGQLQPWLRARPAGRLPRLRTPPQLQHSAGLGLAYPNPTPPQLQHSAGLGLAYPNPTPPQLQHSAGLLHVAANSACLPTQCSFACHCMHMRLLRCKPAHACA